MVYAYVVLQAWRGHWRSSPKVAPRLWRMIRWKSTHQPWPLNKVCYIHVWRSYCYACLQPLQVPPRTRVRVRPPMLALVLCRWTCRPFPLRIVRNITYIPKIYPHHLWTAPAGSSKDKGKGKATDAGAGAMQVDLQAIPSQQREKHYLHPKSISSYYFTVLKEQRPATVTISWNLPTVYKYINSGACPPFTLGLWAEYYSQPILHSQTDPYSQQPFSTSAQNLAQAPYHRRGVYIDSIIG